MQFHDQFTQLLGLGQNLVHSNSIRFVAIYNKVCKLYSPVRFHIRWIESISGSALTLPEVLAA